MKLFVNILQDIGTLHKGMVSLWFSGEDRDYDSPKQVTYVAAPANIRFSESRLKPSFNFKMDTEY